MWLFLVVAPELASQNPVVWTREFQSPAISDQFLIDLFTDQQENVYFLGLGRNFVPPDWYILGKYNPQGQLQWAFQDTTLEIVHAAPDTMGNVYLQAQTPNAPADYILVKLDSSGNEVWRIDSVFPPIAGPVLKMMVSNQGRIALLAQQFQSSGPTPLRIVTCDSNGNVLGTYHRAAADNPVINDMTFGPDGDLHFVGTKDANQSNDKDLWLGQLDDTLGLVWEAIYDSDTTGTREEGWHLAVDASGNTYALGNRLMGSSFETIFLKYLDQGNLGFAISLRPELQFMPTKEFFALDQQNRIRITFGNVSTSGCNIETRDTAGTLISLWGSGADSIMNARIIRDVGLTAGGNVAMWGDYSFNDPVYWVHTVNDLGVNVYNVDIDDTTFGLQFARHFAVAPSGAIYVRGFLPNGLDPGSMFIAKINGALTPIAEEATLPGRALVVPHPLRRASTLVFPAPLPKGSQLDLYDGLGRRLWRRPVLGKQVELNREGIPSGNYYLRWTDPKGRSGIRSLVVR